ncbi:MAG: polyprenyl synthetase family protein [Planctomycetes bacterium]|nr:polyprenyl synthetase family protein [Planctomycetota bacterium]
MPAVYACIEQDLQAVDVLVQEALVTSEPRVASLLEELGQFHGKMLRPALVMLVARALGSVSEEHIRLSAGLEMIHTATLIHDDMIDDGRTRRGQPTPHVRFGNTTAVLLGDYFYTHAFHIVACMHRPELMQRLSAVTNVICEGELHQMCARRDVALSEEEYNRIIHAKTAALCEVATAFGAMNGTEEQVEAAALYGRYCGMAFQIVDDCLDLSGDPQKVGKTLATDIECGRLTLPFIRILQMADPSEREALGQQLLSVSSAEEIAAVRAMVHERGGIESAIATARDYVQQAHRALDVFPDTPDRQVLADVASFIVEREF